ncbi:MAG: nucleotide exchange factor GrpE [Parachlamydia sp.]|jgi:molecular chaperone GrpE|nr:nucleotide exchange factor GrpE [Parachlamydia sp.]
MNEQNEHIPEEEAVEFASAPSNPKQVMMTDEELREIQKELIEYKDKYLRLLADNENARKRMQKERQEMTRFALENLIVDFLHPLDNLENALRFAQDMSEEVKNWAVGFQMILAQFKDILASNGVTPIESKGNPFDPHSHEALEMVETDAYIPGTVVEESVRGYKMGDKIIRPARVKVAKTQMREEELT